MTGLPIKAATWKSLVDANKASSWAGCGVFGTGIGRGYQSSRHLLYVGKSAGPLGSQVGSGLDQAESSKASTDWMEGRKNLSAFWQFVDKIDPTRHRLAWTNICKFDCHGGKKPPSAKQFAEIAEVCMAALGEEIRFLSPKITVIAASDAYAQAVTDLLEELNFKPIDHGDTLDLTTCYEAPDGAYAIRTRHPQGWPNSKRDPVIKFTKYLLTAPPPP